MTPLDVGIVAAIAFGVGGMLAHHQFWRARRERIRTEADAFGDRSDERE